MLLSVNVSSGHSAPEYTDSDGYLTGIDKHPVDRAVAITAPGPGGAGVSGLAGDTIGDRRHHGGDYHAGYAYAREDLDVWQVFGENRPSRSRCCSAR